MMVVFNQIWSIDLIGQFPGVVMMGVAYPFDQVL
jgi:hypothetical protein